MSVTLYGIPNCDTVKKARKWMDAHEIDYSFHDYKKAGAEAGKLGKWIDAAGLDTVLNRRGTTFRKLDEEDKADIDHDKAVRLLLAHPSMIKRPIVEYPDGLLVGFKPEEWEKALM
ncbi:MAG: ArsC family reductase [Sphingomonadaceae bacterium]